jgi:uncharacterized membrane protein
MIPPAVRRAFAEFLALPLLMLAAFAVLAGCMLLLDHSGGEALGDLGATMSRLVFGDAAATANLLGTLAGAVITVTGIAFGLLVLAVGQSAASLTHVVFDQYLRRRSNQVYLGFFVGVALYAVLVLSATHERFNPVLSASLALVLAIGALVVLMLVIYSTIDQMRPARIVEAIAEHILRARDRQHELVSRTRRRPSSGSAARTPVRAESDGYVTAIDLDRLAALVPDGTDDELVLRVSIGTYVAPGDVLADVPAATAGAAGELRGAIRLEVVRDIDGDAAYGIDQLVSIAWKSISTSAQSPAPGEAVIVTLRDLLSRWATAGVADTPRGSPVRVVYEDDVVEALWGAIESMAVVCSESMQAQNAAILMNGLATVFDRLAPAQQDRAAEAVLRMLSGLGDHVPTAALERALERLAAALEARHAGAAAAVRDAHAGLAAAVGRLNSRATRVPAAS